MRRAISFIAANPKTVLGMVVLFATAFVAVVSIKLSQDWNARQYDAQRFHYRMAAFTAERTVGHIEGAYGALTGAARALEADWRTDGDADNYRHLEVLAARGDIADVALLTPDGALQGAVNPDSGRLFATALSHRGAATQWIGAGEDGGPEIYIAERLIIERNVEHLLVARLDLESIAPSINEGQTLALVGPRGFVAIGRGSSRVPARGGDAGELFSVPKQVFASPPASGSMAVHSELLDSGMQNAVGLVAVGETGMTLVLQDTVSINQAAWRNAVRYYIALLLAPILAAAGICAALLAQVDRMKRARANHADHERLFRLAIQSARCGVWDWDTQADTVFITDSLAHMLGRKQGGTLLTSEFVSLIRDDERERLTVAMRSAATSGEVEVEFRAKSLPVWLQARGRAWINPANGQPTGRVVGVAIDVTVQKGNQKRVTTAEMRLREALESMSEGFVLWDPRHRLVLSNHKFREFFNLDQKMVLPGAAYEMMKMASDGAIRSVHPTGEQDVSEYELSDGRWVKFSERETSDGGMVSIGTDITELKTQERQLLESEAHLRKTVDDLDKTRAHLVDLAHKYEQESVRAEQANRAKNEFLANMSHELRTPLNAINGFSEMMLSEMFGPLGHNRYKEYVDDILASGKHLLELIEDILDMAKIEAGKRELEFEVVQPRDLAEQCVRLTRARAKDAGLDLTVDLDALPTILADALAMKQIIINLLTNAFKFTEEGGSVVLRGREHADGVILEVEDTGVGIPEKDIPRLGKPFEQLAKRDPDSAAPAGEGGSGLGLALSKSLVEMHNGQLTISSVLGEGTVVSFFLPFDPTKTDQLVETAPEDVEELTLVLPKKAQTPKIESKSTPVDPHTPDAPPSSLADQQDEEERVLDQVGA